MRGWLLLVCGCGGQAAPCPRAPYDCSNAHDVPVTIEIGTGDPDLAEWTPLPADGALELHDGPQGGYHVYLQARVRGLCPSAIEFSRTLRAPGDALVLRRQMSLVRMVDDGDGSWIFPRAQATFVCPPEVSGVDMAGRALEVEALLTDVPGCHDDFDPRSGGATATIVPTCPEGDGKCASSAEAGCSAR